MFELRIDSVMQGTFALLADALERAANCAIGRGCYCTVRCADTGVTLEVSALYR